MVRAFPALWLLGALILGISTADLISPPCWLFPLLALLGLVLGMAKRDFWYGVAALLLIFTAYTGTRYCLEQQQGGIRSLQRLVEQEQSYTIFASVADWPRLRERSTDIKLDIDSLRDDRSTYHVDGALLLQVSDTTTLLQRGDGVVFEARVYPLAITEHADFDYSRYLRLKGIHGRIYLTTLLDIRIDRRNPLGFLPLVDRLRESTIDVFDRCLTPPSAALAKGLMLGETREIDPEVYAMFRDSGTLHLLAVSGSNVALVLIVVSLLLRPLHFRPRPRYLLLLLVIVIYAGMCRGEPSVLRASVMATLVIGGRLLHRKINLNQIVALTAVLILLYEPAQLFDVGFQLSFVTAWGLVFAVPKITPLFERHHQRRWYRWIMFPLIISFVAQLCSMPLTVLYFQRLPIVALPANLIVVPLVSLCVIGLAAVLLAYVVVPTFGLFVGSLVDPIHRAVILTLEAFGGSRMPTIDPDLRLFGSWGWLFVVLLYCLFIVAVSALTRKHARRLLLFGILSLSLLTVSLAIGRSFLTEPGIAISRLPGGAVVINPTGRGAADVVITSVIARDYPIDQTILLPLLNRHDIDSIGRLFVLGADFAALDDLWRLAIRFGAESVFVPVLLAPSAQETRPADSPDLVALARSIGPPPDYGYRLSNEGLWLRRPGLTLLIAGPGAEPRAVDSVEPPVALVLGSTSRSRPEDLDGLAERGFGPIIVTGSVRPGADGRSPDEPRPQNRLIELKSLGYFVLPIPDNAASPAD